MKDGCIMAVFMVNIMSLRVFAGKFLYAHTRTHGGIQVFCTSLVVIQGSYNYSYIPN